MNESQIVKELLLEGLDDWIPVDRVVELSRDLSVAKGVSLEVAFETTFRSLVSEGLMVVGELGDSGFEPWRPDGVEIIPEVIHKLEELEWLPQGGSYWLANTELGDQLAAQFE